MSFVQKIVNPFRKFTTLDAGVFEFYLFTMGIVIAKLIPAVLTLNVWRYVIVVVIGLVIVVPSVFKKNKQKGWSSFMHNYRNLAIWKLIVYKLLIAITAFLILKLIPVMMLVDIAWYVALAFFGMGYIIAVMYRKK